MLKKVDFGFEIVREAADGVVSTVQGGGGFGLSRGEPVEVSDERGKKERKGKEG